MPPAPPPPAFRYGMFSGTQGVAEIFAAMSVAYSAMRIPSVLATPVHVFPMPAGASAALIYQKTAPHHHYMYNFFDLKLRPLPTTWSVFSEALVTAVRQQQSVFGVYAVQELETLLRCFGTDVDELRQDARLVNFSRPIDACVIHAVTQALRDANPLSIFAAVEAELARLRVAIYDAQPVQPYAFFFWKAILRIEPPKRHSTPLRAAGSYPVSSPTPTVVAAGVALVITTLPPLVAHPAVRRLP